MSEPAAAATARSATLEPSSTPAPRSVASPWLASPAFDAAFFLAPIGLGLLYYCIVRSFPGLWYPVSAAWFVALAYGHYSLTFAFYFDKDHAPYYRAHAVRYYAIPVLLLAGVVSGYVFLPALFFAADWLLTQHHCTKQSTGLGGLYRYRAGAHTALAQKLENGSVYLASGVLVLHGLFRFELVGAGWSARPAYRAALAAGLGLAGALCLAVAVRLVVLAAREGFRRHAPRAWFWATSAAMYTPVLYVPVATPPGQPALEALRTVIVISLTQHWLQYFGIVYLHGRNKYRRPEHSAHPAAPWMAYFPRLAACALVFACGLAFFRALGEWGGTATAAGRAAFGVVLAVGWVHYWLDRQIWAFREPHNRETILPYLKAAPRGD